MQRGGRSANRRQRQLWCVAISAKRYALFIRDRYREPALLREGRLVEVMPQWRFRTLDLSLVHLGNRNMPKPMRLFKEFATRMAPTLFQDLPV